MQNNLKNNIKDLMPSLFKTGLKLDIEEERFKDYTNSYFKNKNNIKKALIGWESPRELKLKFDDRLNMFFLYHEYDPVLGFYLYKKNILQIVPFRNYSLLQAIATVIDYVETLKRKQ